MGSPLAGGAGEPGSSWKPAQGRPFSGGLCEFLAHTPYATGEPHDK